MATVRPKAALTQAQTLTKAIPPAVIDAKAQGPSWTAGGVLEFPETNLALPLAPAITNSGTVTVGLPHHSKGTCHSTEVVWADLKTKGNFVKAIRALKLHILKNSANVSSEFLGPGSKVMTMVFRLRKFPSDLKALPIPLPLPLALPAEGIFVRTVSGKKILSVSFGKGNMDVEALASNAMAVTRAIRKSKSLDTSLVREVLVDADRLTLPVWSKELWEKGDRARLTKSRRHIPKGKNSMGPPVGAPLKKFKAV